MGMQSALSPGLAAMAMSQNMQQAQSRFMTSGELANAYNYNSGCLGNTQAMVHERCGYCGRQTSRLAHSTCDGCGAPRGKR